MFGPSKQFTYCLRGLGSALLVVNEALTQSEQAETMTEKIPSKKTHQAPEQATSYLAHQVSGHAVGGIRNDLNTMLLPMFAEHQDAGRFETEIDDCRLEIYSDDSKVGLPTALDRKILTLLAAHVRDVIQSGGEPRQDVFVHRQDLLSLLNGSNNVGGKDYKRLEERLQRLASVRIVAERIIDATTTRRTQFSWIEGFEEDFHHTGRGKELVRLRITLSQEAFRWITRHQGFDMSHQDFTAISKSSASISRVFDICLARLVYAEGHDVYIQIDDLRRRIPISSPLRHFKSRTLKAALKEISENQSMSRILSASLVKKTETGFEEVAGRAPLESLYLKVSKGPAPLPSVNCLIPDPALTGPLSEHLPPAEALASLDEEGQLELFREGQM